VEAAGKVASTLLVNRSPLAQQAAVAGNLIVAGGIMLKFRNLISGLVFSSVLMSGAAFAQGHDNHTYVRHNEWHKGAKINHDDWNRGEQVDWHAHHLRQPPNGYEWREVDGNFVMAAIATGLIAQTIVDSGH
jgi:Ni/Co efflux regulator RcnB